MLTKTKGIVLNYIKFKESSIIVKVYTRELGLRSYIVNGVRKKTKNNRIALYQPFTLLNMVVYENVKKDIQRISEAEISYKAQSIPFDVAKSSVALFLTELLSKVIVEHEPNAPLYDFLETMIIDFDEKDADYGEFHLYILLHLLDFVGHNIPVSELSKELTEIKNSGQLKDANHLQRKALLEELILFYKEQELLKSELRSLPVLSSVFA